jgi:hypothetical protein
MATNETIKLDTERPTHTSDFIKSDVEKAVFLGDPILDNLLTTILAVTAETWANRRRTLVLERLLADKGISKEMIEGYMPTPEEDAEWRAERDRFIGMTLDPLIREGSLPLSADIQDED